MAGVGIGWLGCGTSHGDADPEPELDPVPTASPRPDAAPRPDFEAGFPTDDAGVPDASRDAAPDGRGTCIDKDDPGSGEGTATALPDTTDGQQGAITVTGVLSGPVDVDFFKLSMADATGSFINANILSPTSGIEICAFVKCKTGTTTVSACTNGTAIKTSDLGTKGCCAAAPGNASPEWDRPGVFDDDSAEFVVRVRQTRDKCTPYAWS